jgi:hypothetical protein
VPPGTSVRQRSSAVEQGTHKPLVGGSIPPAGTTLGSYDKFLAFTRGGFLPKLPTTNSERYRADLADVRPPSVWESLPALA